MALAPPTQLTAVGASALAAPTITTPSLPQATVGRPYTAALAATGGFPPYTWQVNDGQLPPGLSLSTAGLISGTPTTAGTFRVDVLCMDSLQHVASMVIGLQHQEV